MALLRHGLPNTLGTTGVEPQHRAYLHSHPPALPRHPGKFVVASSPEASSQSSGREEGGETPGGEAADTPFFLTHAPQPAEAANPPQHAAQQRQHHHQHGGWQHGAAIAAGNGYGELEYKVEQHGGGEEAGAGGEEPRSRLDLIHEAPYPHRWPSRKRRKCRSLGYLATAAPTIDEEETLVRPSSLSPLANVAADAGAAAGAASARLPYGGVASAPAHQPLPPQQLHPDHLPQLQQPLPPQPQHTPSPRPPPAPPLQRTGSLPLAGAPRAGAPRALQKPLQLAAAAAAGSASKAGQSRTSQHTAKKARTAGVGSIPGGGSAAGGAASKQPGKAVGGKPPGKPPYKPPPQQQQQSTAVPAPPVRRPSSVTLDRQRSGSVPPPPAGPGAGGFGMPGAPAPDHFPPGQLVWAKMPSYPWWPAQVQSPQPNHLSIKHGATDVFVVFYGTADFNWVPRKDLKHFSHTLPDYTKHSAVRNKSLQKAIDEAWVALGRPRPDVNGKPHDG